MNKLKDIFYDKNDILVALIILAIAAVIIFWRVDVIMAYPETLVAETLKNDTDDTSANNPSVVTTDGAIDGNASGGAIDSASGGEDEVKICAIYINYGESLDVVAQNCVAAGLVGSTEEFISTVNAMGAGSSIQSGQHHIHSNVTPEELVQYLIQTGV